MKTNMLLKSSICGVAFGLLLFASSGCQAVNRHQVSTSSRADYQSAQLVVETPTVEAAASAGSITWAVSSKDPAMYRDGSHLITLHNESYDKIVIIYPGNVRLDPQGSVTVNPFRLQGVGVGTIINLTFKYFAYESDPAKQKEVFSKPPVGTAFTHIEVLGGRNNATTIELGWDAKGRPTADKSGSGPRFSGF